MDLLLATLAVVLLTSSLGAVTSATVAPPAHCVAQTTFGCFHELDCGADVHKRCVNGMMIKGHGAAASPEACACACHAAMQDEAPFTLAGIEMGACFCGHGAAPNATRCQSLPASKCPLGQGGPCAVQVFNFTCIAAANGTTHSSCEHLPPPSPGPPAPPAPPRPTPCQQAPCSLPRKPPLIPGVYCKRPYNQCPELNGEGTVPGTCNVGSPGCKQGPQCQSREDNAFMPIFHIVGNYTLGVGTQPTPINDVSSIIRYRGVWHVFHQFGQCGWAHAISYDGAHWKNLRYPIIPDVDPKHQYDACGCYDGSLTHHPDVNNGNPIALYDISPALEPADESSIDDGERTKARSGTGDRPIQGLARPADLNDPELKYWVKDHANPVVGSAGLAGYPSQIWKNGDHWNYVAGGTRISTEDSSFHTWNGKDRGHFPGGGAGGQWFQPLPMTVDGQEAPAGSPTYVISTGGGQRYALGWYHPSNESFTSAQTCTVDYSQQFGWAGMQMAAGRMFNIAWVRGSGANSALSLLRELRYDTATACLVTNPMPELALLRNASLYNYSHVNSSASFVLAKEKLTTLPLGGAGHTVDLEATFLLPRSGVAASFGLAVLAGAHNLSGAVTISINISSVAANGTRMGKVVVERQQEGTNRASTPLLQWKASFQLLKGEAPEIHVRTLIDRSIVETFVAGGRVAGITAHVPPSTNFSNVHLFDLGESEMQLAPIEVKDLQVWSMGCGWNETTGAID